MWNQSKEGISPKSVDRTMFRLFGGIARLARQNGLHVLFYSVQEYRKTTNGKTSDRRYKRLMDRVGRGDHVHIVDRPGSDRRSSFSDGWIHLTPGGMRLVSSELVAKIREIKQELEKPAP